MRASADQTSTRFIDAAVGPPRRPRRAGEQCRDRRTRRNAVEDVTPAELGCRAADRSGEHVPLVRAGPIPLLRAAGGGSIVNLSSVAGKFGFPLRSPYSRSQMGHRRLHTDPRDGAGARQHQRERHPARPGRRCRASAACPARTRPQAERRQRQPGNRPTRCRPRQPANCFVSQHDVAKHGALSQQPVRRERSAARPSASMEGWRGSASREHPYRQLWPIENDLLPSRQSLAVHRFIPTGACGLRGRTFYLRTACWSPPEMSALARLPENAPFPPDAIQQLNRVIGPATPGQRSWLAGFLAGLESLQPATPAAAPLNRPKTDHPVRHRIRQRRGARPRRQARRRPPRLRRPRAGTPPTPPPTPWPPPAPCSSSPAPGARARHRNEPAASSGRSWPTTPRASTAWPSPSSPWATAPTPSSARPAA